MVKDVVLLGASAHMDGVDGVSAASTGSDSLGQRRSVLPLREAPFRFLGSGEGLLGDDGFVDAPALLFEVDDVPAVERVFED